MKRIIYLVLLLGALYAAIMSPYGVLKTKSKIENLSESLRFYVTTKSQVEGSKMSLAEAENNFNSQRTFEIAYSDVSRLVKVLDNVMTVTVSAVNVADPAQYFVPGSAWREGDTPEAVIVALAVDDTVSALRIIDKMELPIYSVAVTEPNIINITFLTGGME